MEYVTHSERDTMDFGAVLGAYLEAGECLLLRGDLGAGKSVLARGVARGLGIAGPMPSPSFTILIPYEGTKKLYHFDLYRLADPEEFYAAGLDEFIGGDGVAVIEWPQMAELEPQPSALAELRRGDGEEDRRIRLTLTGLAHGIEIKEALKRWEAKA